MKKLLGKYKRELDLARDQIKFGINSRSYKIQLFERIECYYMTFIFEMKNIIGEIKQKDNTTYKRPQLPKHVDDWLTDYMKQP